MIPQSIKRAYTAIPPEVRWWLGIAATCGLIGAHLIALGASYALLGVILCLAYLNIQSLRAQTHERGIAILVGALVAFYLLVILETYLGASALYVGPIGSNARATIVWLDQAIVASLIFLYQSASEVKSWIGVLIYTLAYFLFQWAISLGRKYSVLKRIPAKGDAYLLNLYAGVGAWVGVMLMFPFAHSLDGRKVEFTEAVFDVSSSLKTLGKYEIAQKQAEQDNAAMRRFVAQLRDQGRVDQRNELADAIAEYSRRLRQLDDRGRERIQILLQPQSSYNPHPFLDLPKERFPLPPYPEIAPVPHDPDFQNANAVHVVHREELKKRKDAVLNEVTHLTDQRDSALTLIRLFVQDEVEAELGTLRRSEIVNAAVDDIMRTILLLDLAEAIRELRRRIAQLQDQIAREESRSRELRDLMDAYRNNMLRVKRAEFRCSNELTRVAEFLQTDGSFIMDRIDRNIEQSTGWMRRNRPPTDRIDPPNGANEQAVEKDAENQLMREGNWPPPFRVGNMKDVLLRVSENGAQPVSAFAEGMCKAGRNAGQIITALRDLNSELGRTIDSPRNLP